MPSTHYNYFRDYDAAIGRYVESDPLGLRAGINTFAYAFNRPLIWSDPFGLDAKVCLYRDAAMGFGHVGVGPGGGDGTSSFYPGHDGKGGGQVQQDQQRDKSCILLKADPDQDDCMERCRRDREENPGPYNVLTRQCTAFVRDCLLACKIIKKSHRGPFPDLFFYSIGGAGPPPVDINGQ